MYIFVKYKNETWQNSEGGNVLTTKSNRKWKGVEEYLKEVRV